MTHSRTAHGAGIRRHDRPCHRVHATLHKTFWATRIIRGVDHDSPFGRASRYHRTERGGQIHFVQPHQRSDSYRPPVRFSSRRGRFRAAASPDQSSRPRPQFPVHEHLSAAVVWENFRCAVLWAFGYGYAFWRGIEGLAEARERTEDHSASDRPDRPPRLVPAGVLTYAEQRALEIGITIAGGARIILLDEPTAG